MAGSASQAEPNDATPFLPERHSLKALREAADGCRCCHLWRNATQTVFGEGRKASRLMLVGEQPGDREDRMGKPFVGPASRELDRGLAAAGIDRREAYLTNVVKHFSFQERGRRRIHQTPKRFEIDACMPWLHAELAVVQPRVVIALGATAAQALLGRTFKVTQRRGEAIRDSGLADVVLATVHPSSVLRAPDPASRAQAEKDFKADIRAAAKHL